MEIIFPFTAVSLALQNPFLRIEFSTNMIAYIVFNKHEEVEVDQEFGVWLLQKHFV